MCGRGQCVGKGKGLTEEAGSSDSELVYVTLTENSEAMLVSVGSQTL